MKYKSKDKWDKLIRHFERFVDPRLYPDYRANEEDKKAFILFQSCGITKLTDEHRGRILPLLNGQEMKELTIKMLVSEMAEWWSNGWGWYPPIANTIEWEYKERHKHKDIIFIKALIKIMRRCHKDGFEFIAAFSGLSKEEKNKYLTKRLLTSEHETQKV